MDWFGGFALRVGLCMFDCGWVVYCGTGWRFSVFGDLFVALRWFWFALRLGGLGWFWSVCGVGWLVFLVLICCDLR